MQKVQTDVRHPEEASATPIQNGVIHEDGSVHDSGISGVMGRSTDSNAADDDASTRGIGGASPSPGPMPSSPLAPEIPQIRVSTESDSDREPDGDGEADTGDEAPPPPTSSIPAEEVERPRQAAANEDEEVEGPVQDFSFSNKRLCERWLDNLFMVLYEVRRFLIWSR